MIHINRINENLDRKCNNRIQLLLEYKMMKNDWSAWTEDSYASTLWNLTDDEILEFMQKDDFEIEEIQNEVNEYKNIYVD
jgi:hypothetical protein